MNIENMRVELILSAVLAICTIVYTWINWKVWKESKRTREQKRTPHIVAYLKATESSSMLVLHLKNIGEGVGMNVRIDLLKDYNQLFKEGLPLSKAGIFKNNLNVFPPQYEMKFYLASMTKIDYDNEDSFVKLRISYERSDGKVIEDTYELPFNQIIGQNYSNPPETFMGRIPYYLKEISDTLKKIKKV